MPFFGALVKTALDLNAQFQSLPEDGGEIQTGQLRALLQKAKDTAFGKYYGFEDILHSKETVAAYQARVPIFDYGTLNRRWWKQQQDLPDITWPGRPPFFALSSGTTGKKSKRIPVTEAMLASFRAVGQSQIAALTNFDLPAEFYEKDILMLGSSADLTPRKDHLEGEISGINSHNVPAWFEGFYKPGKEIARIDDWETRIAAIAEKAPEWDVSALAGIPSWVRMMLKRIIECHGLETIHDLWPNLRLYATGGVAFGPHRKSFAQLCREPLQIMDTYLASEGFFAYTARPDTLAMRLAFNHGMFFEFIPFDERGFDEHGELLTNPLALPLGAVEEGQEYALLVSSPAGAWRYLIGDTVKFTDLSRYELVISGRTKYFLNVVGSQLSEEKLNAAVAALGEKYALTISEFTVGARKNENGEFIHQWVLGVSDDFDHRALEAPTLATALDEQLKSVNKNYRIARQKALKGLEVSLQPVGRLYGWLEQRKKKGGQIKVPKVMKSKMLRELMDYLAK